MAVAVQLCRVLPPEILETVWSYLPDRTQWSAQKSEFEANYGQLLDGVPRLHSYLATVVRHSRSYIFGLVMVHRRRQYYQLRRWRVGGILYSSYLEYLRECARHHRSHACLALAQDPEPRKRPRGAIHHKNTWTV